MERDNPKTRKIRGKSVVRRTKRVVVVPKKRVGIRYSNFLVTIQTNVFPFGPKWNDERFDEFQDRFEKVLEYLWDPQTLGEFIFFREQYSGDSWDADTILKVDAQSDIEVGKKPRGRRIHSHTLLEIEHKSNLRLDMKAIKRYVISQLQPEVKNVYLKIDVIKDQVKNVLNYIRKDKQLESEDFQELFEELQELKLGN